MEILENNSSKLTELKINNKSGKNILHIKFNNSYKLWFGIGVFIIICASFIFFTSFSDEKLYNYTMATITDIDYGYDDEEDDVYVTYEIDGVKYEDVYLDGFFQFFYTLGEEVEVRYLIENPNEVVYVRFNRVLGGLMWYYGLLSVAFSVFLYYKNKNQFEWC